MASAGNLVFTLAAQTAEFRRDMQRSAKQVQSTQAQMNKRLAKMQQGFQKFKRVATGALGGLVGAAGFGALTQQVSQAATEIDQMNRAAERMGTTTQSIAAVQQAFGKLGVNTEKTNDLMQELQIRLGDAAQGAGPAVDMVDKLGINLERIQKLPVDQQLQVVMEKLRGLENSSQRAAAASAFFSDEGVQPMLDMLKQGEGTIADARKEVELYGQAVRGAEADAVTRMTKAWKDVQNATSGVFRQLTVQLAPTLTTIAKTISDSILPGLRGFGDVIQDFILVGVMRLVQLWNRMKFAATSAVQGIKSTWNSVINSMRRTFADFLESVAEGASNIPALGDATKAHLDNMAAGFNLAAARAEQSNDKIAGSVEQARREMERNNQAIEEVTNQQIRQGVVTDSASEKINTQRSALKGQADAAKESAKATEEAAKKQGVLGMAMDRIEGQFKDMRKQRAKDIAIPDAPGGNSGPGAVQGFASAAGSRAVGGDTMQLLTESGKMAKSMQMLGAAAGNAASSLVSMVLQTEPVQKAMGELMRAIRPIIRLLGRMLAPVIRAVTRALRPVLNALIPAIDALHPLFRVLAETVRDLSPLLRLLGKVIRALSPAIRVAANLFSAMLNPLAAVKNAWEGLGNLPSKVWGWVKNAFTGLVDNILGPVKNAFKDLANKIWDAIKGVFDFGDINPISGGGGGGIVDTVSDASIGSAIGGSVGSVASSVGDSLGFANGAAFSKGNVVPFANGGKVSQPTTFPMSQGRTGLMGEQGPEAIMPLTRGSGGKMGVTLEGAGPLNQLPDVNRQGFAGVVSTMREEFGDLKKEVRELRRELEGADMEGAVA